MRALISSNVASTPTTSASRGGGFAANSATSGKSVCASQQSHHPRCPSTYFTVQPPGSRGSSNAPHGTIRRSWMLSHSSSLASNPNAAIAGCASPVSIAERISVRWPSRRASRRAFIRRSSNPDRSSGPTMAATILLRRRTRNCSPASARDTSSEKCFLASPMLMSGVYAVLLKVARTQQRRKNKLGTFSGACFSEATAGIEPAYKGFADPRLTTWPRRRNGFEYITNVPPLLPSHSCRLPLSSPSSSP